MREHLHLLAKPRFSGRAGILQHGHPDEAPFFEFPAIQQLKNHKLR
jgi:hypothetical protein